MKKTLKKIEFAGKFLLRNKLVIFLLCCFIPDRLIRHKLRKKIFVIDNKKELKYQLRVVENSHKHNIKKLKNKETINIIFMVISNIGSSSNVLEPIYKKFKEDKRYNATIVIAPYTYFSNDYMLETCEKTERYLKDKGFNYINGYDKVNDTFVDVKKIINPDIVFFMMPYDYLSPEEFTIKNYLDTLTCYVPYSYMLANNMKHVLNTNLTNLVWKIFGDSAYHKTLLEKYAYNKGKNIAEFQGFTKVIDLLKKDEIHKDEWARKQPLKIIWAPHHSMGCYANFPRFHNLFLEIAEKYKDKIQIAFRPHPVLKETLIKHKDWGKDRTEEYYRKWAELNNAFYHTGNYTDLFKTSDALILDSVSFIAEYMFTGKPMLFLNTKKPFGFNDFGKMVNKCCYNTDSKEGIINFIEEVLLLKKDIMKEKRKLFVKKYLTPPNEKTASENIYDYVKNELKQGN